MMKPETGNLKLEKLRGRMRGRVKKWKADMRSRASRDESRAPEQAEPNLWEQVQKARGYAA